MRRAQLYILLLLLHCGTSSAVERWELIRAVPSADATQAAAADQTSIYAISNTRIVKYDRRTLEQTGVSRGRAEHLNFAVLHQGKLYCSHSNYPQLPEQSEIKVLDPQTMELTDYHRFNQSPGSLTWAVPIGDEWWCNFAFYQQDNHRSYLARFDRQWRELGRWTYSRELLAKLGTHSLSGGIFRDGLFLVSGHDDQVLFKIGVPCGTGRELLLLDAQPAALTGQGFAADPQTGGLIGINRPQRQMILLERRGD